LKREKKPRTATVIKARAFLAAYRATCNITRSAKLAGISARRHYAWLERYPKYRAAFERAGPMAAEALEDRVKAGAFDGWKEPVFYQGVKCGQVTRFDLGGRQMLLRGAMREKYGPRVELSGEVDTGMKKFAGTLEELLGIYRQLTAAPAETEHVK
jgi:hypothetical protein